MLRPVNRCLLLPWNTDHSVAAFRCPFACLRALPSPPSVLASQPHPSPFVLLLLVIRQTKRQICIKSIAENKTIATNTMAQKYKGQGELIFLLLFVSNFEEYLPTPTLLITTHKGQ